MLGGQRLCHLVRRIQNKLLPNVTVRGTRSQNGEIMHGSRNSMSEIDPRLRKMSG